MPNCTVCRTHRYGRPLEISEWRYVAGPVDMYSIYREAQDKGKGRVVSFLSIASGNLNGSQVGHSVCHRFRWPFPSRDQRSVS